MKAPRIGQALKEDRMIALVRQRLSIPGGCCSFDLPTLHIWLHLAQSQRDGEVKNWLETLAPLNNSLTMVLDLIRQSVFSATISLMAFPDMRRRGSVTITPVDGKSALPASVRAQNPLCHSLFAPRQRTWRGSRATEF